MNGVLVTGASTGIGYACSQALAQAGSIVFAGVRSERDARRLEQLHANVRPILLDVTMQEQIGTAAQTLASSGVPLHAVVNNAGIAVAGPLEYLPIDEFRKQFEVNLFGALAITQAVLPLLREAGDGRIVFMSSVSGQISPPFVGPYAASKHALESLADSMRMELSPFGIRVSIVQPGNVRTPIWQKGRDGKEELVSRMPAKALEYYGTAVDALVAVTQREERTGIDPALVARAVLHAISSPSPKARYPVGAPQAWQRRMAMNLPERLRDRMILKTMKP
jgi:NAD(P)-dependent dehydrogenase (short-subunit alcohol dehydrogenase family)